MSVTFNVEMREGDLLGTAIVKYDYDLGEDVTVQSFDAADYFGDSEAMSKAVDQAWAELQESLGGVHPLFADYTIVNRWVTDDLPSVNVNNGNAAAILQAAGLAEEFGMTEDGIATGYVCGIVEPQRLADALILLTAIDDPGTDTITEGGDGYATMVHMGRRAGYLNDRAAQIIEVCEAAKSVGRQVTFG